MGSRYVADNDRLKHKRISAGARHKRPHVKVPGEDTANMRAVLIMLVMLYHSTIIYSEPNFVYHPQRQLVSIDANPLLASILGIASFLFFTPMMGLFFALSGFSFVYTLKKSTNYWVLLQKKFWRLLVPYLFVGSCLMLPIKILVGHPSYRGVPLGELLVKVFITGSLSGHLWFVYSLFLMFAVFGISYHFFGLTWKGDCGVLFLSVACFIASSILAGKIFIISSFRAYYLFFVMGLMLHRYWHVVMTILGNKHYWPVIVVVYICLVVLAGYIEPISDGLYHVLTRTLCMPFPMILFKLIPQKTNRFFILIGDNSMRLYLLHSNLLYFSFAYWLNIDPVLMVLINFVGFGLLALGIGLLMERLHVNFLLGERDFHARPIVDGSFGGTTTVSLRG